MNSSTKLAEGPADPASEALPSRKGGIGRRGRPSRDQSGRVDDELLTHALDHFLAKGFEGTTLNALTASLGMSKQTVYGRYGDKITLFRASLKRAIDSWLVPLQLLPELECDDFETTLVNVARLVVTMLMSPAGLQLIRITNAESYRMPEIGAYTYQHGHLRIAQFLTDLFQRRLFPNANGALNLGDLPTSFLNLMSGPARRNAWGIDEEHFDLELFVHQQVRLFLRGALSATKD